MNDSLDHLLTMTDLDERDRILATMPLEQRPIDPYFKHHIMTRDEARLVGKLIRTGRLDAGETAGAVMYREHPEGSRVMPPDVIAALDDVLALLDQFNIGHFETPTIVRVWLKGNQP